MTNLARAGVLSVVVLLFGACASAAVQRGTLIGAATGAVLGSGTGVLISNDDLLGSSQSEASGDLALTAAPTIGASALIGAVFGAIVGAMIGHGNENPAAPADPPASPQAQRTALPLF